MLVCTMYVPVCTAVAPVFSRGAVFTQSKMVVQDAGSRPAPRCYAPLIKLYVALSDLKFL